MEKQKEHLVPQGEEPLLSINQAVLDSQQEVKKLFDVPPPVLSAPRSTKKPGRPGVPPTSSQMAQRIQEITAKNSGNPAKPPLARVVFEDVAPAPELPLAPEPEVIQLPALASVDPGEIFVGGVLVGLAAAGVGYGAYKLICWAMSSSEVIKPVAVMKKAKGAAKLVLE